MTKIAGTPADAVTAVAERLVGYVTRYEADRDNRAVFAYLDLYLTRNLAVALRVGDPDFDDPAWVIAISRTRGLRTAIASTTSASPSAARA